MSFRGRLLVFFTIIVVIPMIAVAIVLFSLTADSEHGKADARLAGALGSALNFYAGSQQEARGALRRVARDDTLRAALRARDRDAIERRLSRLVDGDPDLAAASFFPPDGSAPASAGKPDAIARASAAPTTGRGERLGTLTASTTTA